MKASWMNCTMMAALLIVACAADAQTLRLDFEAVLTRVDDNDGPFGGITPNDVATGYFLIDTEEYDFNLPDGRASAGPTSYSCCLQLAQAANFIQVYVEIDGMSFQHYPLGVSSSMQLWFEPPGAAGGFDQFAISSLTSIDGFSTTTAYAAAVLQIQLVDALVDENIVQQFEWSAVTEPERAFLRPFGFEIALPDAAAPAGRHRLEVEGSLTYVRLAPLPVPVPPALPLLVGALALLRSLPRPGTRSHFSESPAA